MKEFFIICQHDNERDIEDVLKISRADLVVLNHMKDA